MNSKSTIDFLSRLCRTEHHGCCAALWAGFGFVICCKCECHKKKNNAIDGYETSISIADHFDHVSNGAVVKYG